MCVMISPFSAPYFTVRPANFKILFWSPKYLFKKNSNRLKEKYTNEENKQNLEADIPKTITNIAILSNKRKRRFVQVFPFSWSS